MAVRCSQCGKSPSSGNNVSHSNRKTRRRFLPNIFFKRLKDQVTGEMVRVKICSKCLKAQTKV